jgi:hypothetical protein
MAMTHADNENQGRTPPVDPAQGPKRTDLGGNEAGNEQPHPQPRHISQEEMQKIMPPSHDPDDPQSP